VNLGFDVNMFTHLLENALPLLPPHFTARLNRATALLCVTICTFLLPGCGGGGGGAGSSGASAAAVGIQPSAQFKGTLVNTALGAGTLVSDWSAATCTDNRQKNWVRSWLNENYLFYRDAPLTSIDPNTYTDIVDNLFLDYTVRGVPSKDRFSFVVTQAEADAVFQSGTTTDVGFTLRRDTNNVGIHGGIIRIAYVDPNGPAAAAGFKRGMVLTTVDGVPTSDIIPLTQFDQLFNSAAGTSSVVGVQDTVGGLVHTLTVASANFATSPVIVVSVLPDATTGYLAYNSFAAPVGEVQLADAFKFFAAAGVTDLVVDLRYNGGGFLDIAAELGYMVAGQAQSGGKVFETLAFNDKRSADNFSIGFADTITDLFGNGARAGPLAALNLQRVSVLTSGSTCSASEAFISALRGIDIDVLLVGGTTCGKPYGFTQADNCTLAFFGLEFEGRNNKGEVTPVTGIPATCAATDDLDHPLGDPAEGMLATALGYRIAGSCPAAAIALASDTLSLRAGAAQASAAMNARLQNPNALNADMEFMTRPLETVKLYRKTR
jgi:carboxyl-terminal processing protease